MGSHSKRLKKDAPRGRGTHEFSSRVNQAWRSPLDRDYDPDFNISYIVGSHHTKCICGAVIRVRNNGFAICENKACGIVWNDEAPPPKIYDSHQREFFKMAKA